MLFDYFGYPPELNLILLSLGPGALPMKTASAGFKAVEGAFEAAATAAEGEMTSLSETWRGPTAEIARSAFRRHAGWLREQGALLKNVSTNLSNIADAYTKALGGMPTIPEFEAVYALRADAAATSAVPVVGTLAAVPIEAAAEAAYAALWTQAVVAMVGYDIEMVSQLSSLPTPTFSPPITPPMGGVSPLLLKYPGGIPPTSTELVNQVTKEVTKGTVETTEQVVQETTEQAIQEGTQEATQQVAEQVTEQMSNQGLDSALSDQGLATQSEQGFPGTSTTSSTLEGLKGGVGSLAPIGMLAGGFGSMAGSSTGFRMPQNWKLGAPATPAAPALPQAQSAPVRQPPRGATAPKAAMRRRKRDDDEERPSKVFVPGEPQDVPELDEPLMIGVIEYIDDEPDQQETVDVLGEAHRGRG